MKTLEELALPQDLRYTPAHVWLRKEADGSCTVGVSAYAQDRLGEVVYVELSEAGRHLEAGEEFGTIESVKSVNALYMPLAGTISECNAALADAPSVVNADCYGAGWMLRLVPDDPAAMDGLQDAAAYRKTLA